MFSLCWTLDRSVPSRSSSAVISSSILPLSSPHIGGDLWGHNGCRLVRLRDRVFILYFYGAEPSEGDSTLTLLSKRDTESTWTSHAQLLAERPGSLTLDQTGTLHLFAFEPAANISRPANGFSRAGRIIHLWWEQAYSSSLSLDDAGGEVAVPYVTVNSTFGFAANIRFSATIHPELPVQLGLVQPHLSNGEFQMWIWTRDWSNPPPQASTKLPKRMGPSDCARCFCGPVCSPPDEASSTAWLLFEVGASLDSLYMYPFLLLGPGSLFHVLSEEDHTRGGSVSYYQAELYLTGDLNDQSTWTHWHVADLRNTSQASSNPYLCLTDDLQAYGGQVATLWKDAVSFTRRYWRTNSPASANASIFRTLFNIRQTFVDLTSSGESSDFGFLSSTPIAALLGMRLWGGGGGWHLLFKAPGGPVQFYRHFQANRRCAPTHYNDSVIDVVMVPYSFGGGSASVVQLDRNALRLQLQSDPPDPLPAVANLLLWALIFLIMTIFKLQVCAFRRCKSIFLICWAKCPAPISRPIFERPASSLWRAQCISLCSALCSFGAGLGALAVLLIGGIVPAWSIAISVLALIVTFCGSSLVVCTTDLSEHVRETREGSISELNGIVQKELNLLNTCADSSVPETKDAAQLPSSDNYSPSVQESANAT